MMTVAIRWMVAATLLLSLDAAARGIDVRLVIDVSGSMKTGDPEYLREDVLNDLVEMLPPGSRAGVWTFGRMANMVVPHGVIDAGWRRAARAARSRIGSVALRTNLGDALAKAAWDANDVSDEWDRHIVLVTDGRVDLADDPSANDTQRRSIAADLLPRLRAANIRLDCLALSDDADFEFLKQLASATNGYAGRADTVTAVKDYLARAIGTSVASPDEVAVGSFAMAEGAAEVTVFAEGTGGAFVLMTPTGERLDAQTSAVGVRRHDGDGVSLMTLSEPASGQWRFSPATAHVQVFSRLGIDIRADETAEAPSLVVAVTDAGAPIDAPPLNALLAVEAELKTLYGTEPLTVTARAGGPLAYDVSLGSSPLTADDEVTVRVVGETFERTRAYTERVAHPIDADFRDAGDGNAGAMVHVNIADMDPASLRVLGTTRVASGRVKLVVGAKQPDGAWLVAIPGLDKKVDVRLKMLFNSLNRKEIEVESDPISLELPLPRELHIGLDADGHVIVDPVRPPPIAAAQDPSPQPATIEPPRTSPVPAMVEPARAGRELAPWEWVAMAAVALASVGLLAWAFVRSRSVAPDRGWDAAFAGYRAALAAAGAKPSVAATT
jgi:hypothetical protein